MKQKYKELALVGRSSPELSVAAGSSHVAGFVKRILHVVRFVAVLARRRLRFLLFHDVSSGKL